MAFTRAGSSNDYVTFTKAASSISSLSIAVLFRANGTPGQYAGIFEARDTVVVGLGCTEDSSVIFYWGGGEFATHTGVTVTSGSWCLVGGSCDGSTAITYCGVMGSGSLTTHSHAIVGSLSPASWTLAADTFDPTNRRAPGDYAEAVFESGVAWTADAFTALQRGFSPRIVRPTATFHAPLIRDYTELKSGATSSVTGSPTIGSAHAPIIMPRGRRTAYAPSAAAAADILFAQSVM